MLVARPAVAVPDGGLPCWSPANPAFSLLSCPHPPARARRALFPGGKGEIFSLFRRGLRPRHPGTYLLTALTDHAEQVSCAREPAVQRSGREISCLKNVPPGFNSGDARGEAPCMNKLWAPPFPPGRGAGGIGAESKPKAGSARDKQSNPPQGFLYGRSAGVKEVNAAGVKFMPPDVAKKPRMWYTECGKPTPIYAREKEP